MIANEFLHAAGQARRWLREHADQLRAVSWNMHRLNRAGCLRATLEAPAPSDHPSPVMSVGEACPISVLARGGPVGTPRLFAVLRELAADQGLNNPMAVLLLVFAVDCPPRLGIMRQHPPIKFPLWHNLADGLRAEFFAAIGQTDPWTVGLGVGKAAQ